MQTFHDACRAIMRATSPAVNYAVNYAQAGLRMIGEERINRAVHLHETFDAEARHEFV